ncbi:putative reverse transcriptase domain-containing protein [Tanacetum coccineum]
MTKLTQKKVKFEWGDKQEAAFQLLKQKLCSAPILALPEGKRRFHRILHSSKKCLGAVYDAKRKGDFLKHSRQLKIPWNKNSTTHDLNLISSSFRSQEIDALLYNNQVTCSIFNKEADNTFLIRSETKARDNANGLEKVREVAYNLELPDELSIVHNTFHVSNLKKGVMPTNHYHSVDGLHIDDNFHYVEEPLK